MRPTRPLADRFWEKVNKDGPTQPHMDSPCWVWTAYKNGCGYGTIRRGSENPLAHRVAWELCRGPIPGGLLALHCCDVPACVRPDHLVFGSNSDNILDMLEKGRSPRGERNASSKLSTQQVETIRAIRGAGFGSLDELADMFGVHMSTIGRIIDRTKWKHVA